MDYNLEAQCAELIVQCIECLNFFIFNQHWKKPGETLYTVLEEGLKLDAIEKKKHCKKKTSHPKASIQKKKKKLVIPSPITLSEIEA